MLLGLVYTQTPQLTGYLYAGREKLDQTTFSGTLVNDQYGYGSPAYDNAGCYALGASASTCVANTSTVEEVTAGFWWKYYQGVLGNLQLGLQAGYVQRDPFAGWARRHGG